MKKQKKADTLQAYLFLLPMLLFLGYFLYRSVFATIGYSFTRFDNFQPAEFAGLANYRKLFADTQFWNSLRLTFIWSFLSAVFLTSFGLLLALLMEFFTKSARFMSVSRTILFMPEMMSLLAVGLLWSLIYDPSIGVITGIMRMLGFAGKFEAYANPDMAIYVAFIPILWRSTGFSMVIFSAALQGIPTDIIECSVVEGTSKLQRIVYIMLPNIIKTVTMVFSLNMISGFKAFDFLYALTGGGPGISTQVTSLYAYTQAYKVFKFDYAAAMLAVMLLCVAVLVILYNVLTGKLEKKIGP